MLARPAGAVEPWCARRPCQRPIGATISSLMRPSFVRALCVAAALALGACADQPPRPPVPDVRAYAGADGESVEVRVGPLAPATQVGAVRLLAPDGRAVQAAERRTRRGIAGTRTRPGIAVGATGGSESGIDPSIGLSLPLHDWSWFRDDAREYRAVIARIPPPADYRPGAPGWRVEVELIDPAGGARTRTVPVSRRRP